MFKKIFIVTCFLSFLLLAAVILQQNNLLTECLPQRVVSTSYLAYMSSSVVWSQSYGGLDLDLAYAFIQTSDKGYAIAGLTRSFGAGSEDFWLIKTDSFGNMEWNKTYGGAGSDIAYAVVQTSDSGYVLAGCTDSIAFLVKTDSVGRVQWNRTYLGGVAFSVVQTSDGGYVLAGSADDDFWLIKTDAFGFMQWSKAFSRDGHDVARCVVQTRDGGYALLGTTRPGDSEGDFLLIKTDSSGNIEWSRTYGSQDKDEGHCVVQTADGGYVLSGLMWTRGGSGSAGVIKTDSVGSIQWKRNYDGGTAWSIALTSDGGYIIACSKLIKIDSEGNEQWAKTLDGSPYDVIQANDGGYAVAGVITNDFWLAKTDSEGNYNSSTAEPTTTPTADQEPFSITLVIATGLAVAVVGIILLFYFKKPLNSAFISSSHFF